MVKVIALLGMSALSWLSVSCAAAEFNIALGSQHHKATMDSGDPVVDATKYSDSGYHLEFGIKNRYGRSGKNLFGAGIDVDDILGKTLVGLRALDYQRILFPHLRVGGFIGAASFDSGLPQNGYYLGMNIQYTDIVIKGLDIGAEYRYGRNLARDRLRSSDPQGPRPDIFMDFSSVGIAVNWRF